MDLSDELKLASLSWLLPQFSLSDYATLLNLKQSGVKWESLLQETPVAPHILQLLHWGDYWNELERSLDQLKKAYRDLPVQLFPFYEITQEQNLGLRIDRPFLLHGVGHGSPLDGYKLGVVGSREPRSGLLEHLDQVLESYLADKHVTIVSGGARGVDQAAHRSALSRGRATLVWVPSGCLNLYPQNLNSWLSFVADGSATFLSPFHPNLAMRKNLFARRNSFIAACSDALLIASAAHKSGSMITARKAIEYGVPLYAFPSDPWCTSAQGSSALIRDGAHPVLGPEDLPGLAERAL